MKVYNVAKIVYPLDPLWRRCLSLIDLAFHPSRPGATLQRAVEVWIIVQARPNGMQTERPCGRDLANWRVIQPCTPT